MNTATTFEIVRVPVSYPKGIHMPGKAFWKRSQVLGTVDQVCDAEGNWNDPRDEAIRYAEKALEVLGGDAMGFLTTVYNVHDSITNFPGWGSPVRILHETEGTKVVKAWLYFSCHQDI